MKTVLFILAMVLSVPPSLAQSKGEMPFTTSSTEASKLLRQALVAYGDVRLDEGSRLAREAIVKDPDFGMAHMLLYTPDREQRKQNQDKAESLKLSGDEKLFLSGMKAYMDNKPTSEFFGPVLAKYPKDDYMQMIAMLNSDTKTRVEIGEGLVKRSPKFAPGYNLLGYAYMDQNEMAKAETSFNKYVSLRPDLPNVYDSKGDYMMRTGNFKEAVPLFEKAVSMGMTGSGTKVRRAGVRLKNADISDKDVEEIKKVVSSSAEAIKKGNVDGYIALLDEQAIEIFANQTSNIGAASIRQRLKGQSKNGSFTSFEQTIEAVKGLGRIALAWGKVEWTFKPNEGNETAFKRDLIFILRRQDDSSWRIVGSIRAVEGDESADDGASARKVFTSWNAFIKRGEIVQENNLDVLAALYSSQAIEIFADGRSNVGIGNLRARWSGYLGNKWEVNSLGPIGVEVVGRRAVAWGAAVSGSYPKDSQQLNKYDFVWVSVLTKETDDQWRILALHWTVD